MSDPPSVVTTRSTSVPVPAGVTAVKLVPSVATLMPVSATPPSVAVVFALSWVPDTVIVWPP